MNKKPITPVCPECGSDNIFKDAFAEWDFEKQDWVLNSVYDDIYCNNDKCYSATNGFNIEPEWIEPENNKGE